MAVYYWDYWTDQSPTTSTASDWTTPSGATGTGVWWSYTTTTMSVVRKYLIKEPESWTDEVSAAFVHLLNDETNTGFKIEMLIRGDIRITDPSIDTRTMVEFVPLLKSRAVGKDRETVETFFEEHSPI